MMEFSQIFTNTLHDIIFVVLYKQPLNLCLTLYHNIYKYYIIHALFIIIINMYYYCIYIPSGWYQNLVKSLLLMKHKMEPRLFTLQLVIILITDWLV